MPARTPRTSLE